ncbi:hypothetical protein evm_007739 [Chilo suppressalis]|nr:hypothetical protein evm_007739 [Chilo suppressalis]
MKHENLKTIIKANGTFNKTCNKLAARRRTGGGVEDEIELSELEERIVALCGGEGFSTGDIHLGIQSFPGPEQTGNSQYNRDGNTVARRLFSSSSSSAVGTSQSILHNTQLAETVPQYIHHPSLSPPPITLSHTPTPIPMPTPSPSRRGSTQVVNRRYAASTSSRHATLNTESTPVASPSRRIRAHNAARASRASVSSHRTASVVAPSPSQRRTEYSTFTERFLRIEEQQLEIQRSYVGILQSFLERDAERQKILAEAVTALGRGLESLAEANKRYQKKFCDIVLFADDTSLIFNIDRCKTNCDDGLNALSKYWSDKKSAIKKKVAARSAARRRTGGGVEDEIELSELEERIVALCGGEGFSTGDLIWAFYHSANIQSWLIVAGIGLEGPEQTGNSQYNRDGNTVARRLFSSSSARVEQAKAFYMYNTQLAETVPQYIHHPSLSPHPNTITYTNPNSMPTPSPSRRGSTQVVNRRYAASTSSRHATLNTESTPVASPSRRIRAIMQLERVAPVSSRRTASAPSPSQRRTIDRYRFLRIEEQQLEIQRSYVRILQSFLERDAERQRSW